MFLLLMLVSNSIRLASLFVRLLQRDVHVYSALVSSLLLHDSLVYTHSELSSSLCML